jgi:hypothetical protein
MRPPVGVLLARLNTAPKRFARGSPLEEAGIRNLGPAEDGAGVLGLYTRLTDGCFPCVAAPGSVWPSSALIEAIDLPDDNSCCQFGGCVELDREDRLWAFPDRLIELRSSVGPNTKHAAQNPKLISEIASVS